MYDFSRDGLAEFPVGKKLSFYEDKLPDYKVTSRKEFYDRRISSTIFFGDVECTIVGNIDRDDIVDLIEVSWLSPEVSFEGLPLAGLSIQQLCDLLVEKGFDAEIEDEDMLAIPEEKMGFFFYEEVPATIHWWTSSYEEKRLSFLSQH